MAVLPTVTYADNRQYSVGKKKKKKTYEPNLLIAKLTFFMHPLFQRVLTITPKILLVRSADFSRKTAPTFASQVKNTQSSLAGMGRGMDGWKNERMRGDRGPPAV